MTAYFGSNAITIISGTDNDVILDHSFRVIFNKTDNWINAASGWVTESDDGDFGNISAYNPLPESS